MDKEDQLEFIKQLAAQNESSNRNHRNLFSLLALFLALGKFYMVLCQIFYPFQTGPHSNFIDVVDSETIIVAELTSSIGYFTLVYYIRIFSEPNQKSLVVRKQKISWWISLLLPLFPLIYLYLSPKPQDFIVFVWFGIGNVVLSFTYWFVEWSLIDTETQILSLHNYTYDFKKV